MSADDETELDRVEGDLAAARRVLATVEGLLRVVIAANEHAPSQVWCWHSLMDACHAIVGHRLVVREEHIDRNMADEFSGGVRRTLGVEGRAL